MKTLFVLGAIMAGGAAAANSLPQVFASCAGRFSAELEHAWLMQDQRADVFESRRARFEELLGAVGGDVPPARLLDQRIKAKAAHAHVLQAASFSRNESRARWARRRADVEIGYCETFLLDG